MDSRKIRYDEERREWRYEYGDECGTALVASSYLDLVQGVRQIEERNEAMQAMQSHMEES